MEAGREGQLSERVNPVNRATDSSRDALLQESVCRLRGPSHSLPLRYPQLPGPERLVLSDTSDATASVIVSGSSRSMSLNVDEHDHVLVSDNITSQCSVWYVE